MKLATMAALLLLAVTACNKGPFKETIVFSDFEYDYCPLPERQISGLNTVEMSGGTVTMQFADKKKKFDINVDMSYEEIRDDNAAYLWHIVLNPAKGEHINQINIIMSKDFEYMLSFIEDGDDIDPKEYENEDEFTMFTLLRCKATPNVARCLFATHPTDADYENMDYYENEYEGGSDDDYYSEGDAYEEGDYYEEGDAEEGDGDDNVAPGE